MTSPTRPSPTTPNPASPPAKIFLEGRYRKLTRDLPQTVFYCPDCKGHPRRRRGCERCEGFGKLTRDSVQELLAWVAGAAFKTRKNKFHGAGREDVNVRMLGRGRPFVLELLNPRNFDVDLAALEAEVNRRNEGRLEIEGMHFSDKPRVVELKETKHAKQYRARVRLDGTPGDDAVRSLVGQKVDVVQHTPERVAHRRAKLDRERWVIFDELTAVEGDPGAFDVVLRTQHGTYVKEAMSGENGQTVPSLASLLGVGCVCETLDVLEILPEDGTLGAEAPQGVRLDR